MVNRTLLFSYILGAILIVPMFVSAWAVPLQAPPLGNSEAALSTNSNSQIKNGDLIVNAFAAFMDSLFQKKLGIGRVPSIYSTLDVNPTITLTDSLKNIQSGITFNGSTMANYYGTYIAAPLGAGVITNKYALVTEPTAGKVGIGTITPPATLSVAGGVQAGDDTSACTVAKAGTIRWHGGVTEICTGYVWTNIINKTRCEASGGAPMTAGGNSVSTYSVASVVTPSTCPPALISTCTNGSWSVPPQFSSCVVLDEPVYGCIYSNACNFNPYADVSDGSCYFIGDSCESGTNNCNESSGGSIGSDCSCDASTPEDHDCTFVCTDSGRNDCE